jgi:hypothetical protein
MDYIAATLFISVGIALLILYSREKDDSVYKNTYKTWGIVGIVFGVAIIVVKMIWNKWGAVPPPPVRVRPLVQMNPLAQQPAVAAQAAQAAVEQINQTANQAIQEINNHIPIANAVVEQPNGNMALPRRNNLRQQ